jgi:hypothetical protein
METESTSTLHHNESDTWDLHLSESSDTEEADEEQMQNRLFLPAETPSDAATMIDDEIQEDVATQGAEDPLIIYYFVFVTRTFQLDQVSCQTRLISRRMYSQSTKEIIYSYLALFTEYTRENR